MSSKQTNNFPDHYTFSVSVTYDRCQMSTQWKGEDVPDEERGLDLLAYEADRMEEVFAEEGKPNGGLVELWVNGNEVYASIRVEYKDASRLVSRRARFVRAEMPDARPVLSAPKKERA